MTDLKRIYESHVYQQDTVDKAAAYIDSFLQSKVFRSKVLSTIKADRLTFKDSSIPYKHTSGSRSYISVFHTVNIVDQQCFANLCRRLVWNSVRESSMEVAPISIKQTEEIKIMSSVTPFLQTSLVYDKPIEKCSREELIDAIKKIEDLKTRIKPLMTVSKSIREEYKGYDHAISVIALEIDERAGFK